MADHHAENAAHDYVHGQMKIDEQAKTWDLFKVLAKWGTVGVSAVLVLITLWFCTPAGFIGGLVGGAVVLGGSIVGLRSKKVEAH